MEKLRIRICRSFVLHNLLVTGLGLLISSGAFGACKSAPLKSDQLNEAGVRRYLEIFRSKGISIEDFTCCLPEVFSKNYLVVHSSVAAQDSIPESPRVIMTDFVANDRGVSELPRAFFSINGGHSGLHQTNSVEAALVDPKTGKVELFDIDFSSGRPEMSKANPQICLACHGTNGQAVAGGPHLIFDGPNIWPRFVNGTGVLARVEPGSPPPPGRDELLARLEDASRKALKTNPRFKCLDPVIPNTGFQMELDQAIAKLNRLRVAPVVTETRDYEKFKFAIVGSDVCRNMLTDIDCQLSSHLKDAKPCQEWIAPAALRAMRDESHLREGIRKASNVRDLDKAGMAIFNIRKKDILKSIHTMNASQIVDRIDFELRTGILTPKSKLLPPSLNKVSSLILRKYAVDTELYHGSVKPLTRFLFESRGISTSSWGTDIVAGYQRAAVELTELVEAESPSGSLRSAVYEGKGDLCERLRKASFEATATGENRASKSQRVGQ